MIGHQNGIVGRLKEGISDTIDIYCVAHELEGGIVDGIKHNLQMREVTDALSRMNKEL